MDETPRQRLARLVAGVPANSSPMPNFANGVNAPPSAMPNPAAGGPAVPSAMPNFAAPGSSSAYLPPLRLPQGPAPAAPGPYDFLPPFTGLRNEPQGGLPAFEQPGGSLPFERYYQPPEMSPTPQAPAQPAMPSAQMQPQMQPPPMQTGGQGYAGPDPMLPSEYDPMKDPRYLPEQWAGAFNPKWQK